MMLVFCKTFEITAEIGYTPLSEKMMVILRPSVTSSIFEAYRVLCKSRMLNSVLSFSVTDC